MPADLTRRSLLHGRLLAHSAGAAEDDVHISSAVVTVLPPRREDVLQALAELPGVEIHQRSASKIVIVMEAADSGTLGGRLAEIAGWQGVLSANMVFEQIERLPMTEAGA